MSPPRPRAYRLPGLGLNATLVVVFLGLFVLLPISALAAKSVALGPAHFWEIITDARALATYRVTLLAAFGATVFNALAGLLLAWVLVRYRWTGRGLLDAIIDLPFALPTAVSGLALTTLFATKGWLGAPLAELGIKVAFAPAGILVAMAFTSLPFVVRAVQPVLQTLEPELEEAALTLGTRPFTIFRRVIFPAILPALATGATLAFARSIGEFGAVVFIAGNIPYRTEITALLAYIRLEEYDYAGSAAVATVMLVAAFAIMLLVNRLENWGRRLAAA